MQKRAGRDWPILSWDWYFKDFFQKVFSFVKSCYFCNAFQKSKRSQRINIP
jgi:hypothetical protein